MLEFQVELDINFADLGPELQNKLKTSKSASRDFLAIHTTDRCYNPADGTWDEQTTAKKRDFGSTLDRAIPHFTAEDNVQQAMLQYHQRSVLPSWTSHTFAATVSTSWPSTSFRLFNIPLNAIPHSSIAWTGVKPTRPSCSWTCRHFSTRRVWTPTVATTFNWQVCPEMILLLCTITWSALRQLWFASSS